MFVKAIQSFNCNLEGRFYFISIVKNKFFGVNKLVF